MKREWITFPIFVILKVKNMRGISILAAFIGGIVVGAASGVLFAPEKGEETRSKIAEILRKKGIKLSRTELDELVDEITDAQEEA